MGGLTAAAVKLFDWLAAHWEDVRTRKQLGTAIVVLYLLYVGIIELSRQGLLSHPLSDLVPRNHFAAVDLAFRFLLIVEVVSLVFVLADSVSRSVGKQFELLALILVRKAFLKFAALGEPIVWEEASPVLLRMVSDAGGALLVFAVVGIYYRVQRHRRITRDEQEEESFVAWKKVVALGLLALFAVLAAYHLSRQLTGDPFPFFEVFYLVLIFSDVLIVLIAFRYSTSFRVLFRNSGFAISTVLIRLALTAPPFLDAAIGVGAALFALGVSLAYHEFAEVMAPAAVAEIREEEGAAEGS